MDCLIKAFSQLGQLSTKIEHRRTWGVVKPPSGRMAIVLVTFTSSKLPRFGQE